MCICAGGKGVFAHLHISAEQISWSGMPNKSVSQVYSKVFSRKVVPISTFPELTVSIFQSKVPGAIGLLPYGGTQDPVNFGNI